MLNISGQPQSEYRAPLVEMTDENANRQNQEPNLWEQSLMQSAKESAKQRRRNQSNALGDQANTIKNLSSCSSLTELQ